MCLPIHLKAFKFLLEIELIGGPDEPRDDFDDFCFFLDSIFVILVELINLVGLTIIDPCLTILFLSTIYCSSGTSRIIFPDIPLFKMELFENFLGLTFS
jgi:hypothetical protein